MSLCCWYIFNCFLPVVYFMPVICLVSLSVLADYRFGLTVAAFSRLGSCRFMILSIDSEESIYFFFGQYLESGQYVLQSDGTLKNKDGKDEILDSTVTFFRKEPEGKQTSNNTSFKGKKVYTSYSKPIG